MLRGCHLEMNACVCIFQAHIKHTYIYVQGNFRARKREGFVFCLLECHGNSSIRIPN